MHHKLKNENGYTLFITLCILVIISILTTSLFTLTLNGTTRSETRENKNQSHNLAVKGEEFFVSKLNKLVEEQLGAGKKINEYEKDLSKTLNSHLCPTENYTNWNEGDLAKFSIKSDTGSSYFCIAEPPTNVKLDGGLENKYKKNVKVKSIGVADHNQKTEISDTFQIGIDYYDFDYSLSTHPSKKQNVENSELDGSLLFFGAVQSDGNMNVASNLITSNKIQYKDYTADSLYPALINSHTNKVLVGGDTKTYKSTTNLDTILKNGLTNNAVEEPLNHLVDSVRSHELVYGRAAKFTKAPINVKESIKKMRTTPDDPDINAYNVSGLVDSVGLAYKTYSLTNVTSDLEKLYLMPKLDSSEDYDNKFRVFGHNNKFKNISFYNDLELRYGVDPRYAINDVGTLGLTVDNAYIAKDLNIGFLDEEAKNALTDLKLDRFFQNTTFLDDISTFTSLAKTGVKLNGTYYVEGDVRIVNAHLTGNATIYVGGNVTILYSELGDADSLNPNDKLNLNIIADGDITMRHVSYNNAPRITVTHNLIKSEYTQSYDTSFANTMFRNNRSEINGLIYSNSKIDINSPTSYLTINGAVHSNTLILQGIRGRSVPVTHTHTGNCNIHLSAGDKSWERVKDNSLIDLDAHCFTKASIQEDESYSYSYSLIGEELVTYTIPITPRLIVNYDERFSKSIHEDAMIIKLDEPTRTSD